MKTEHFDIPSCDYFSSKNDYSGSYQLFNYKISSDGEKVKGIIWFGMNCSAKSEIKSEREFLYSPEVSENILEWLEDELKTKNSSPAPAQTV